MILNNNVDEQNIQDIINEIIGPDDMEVEERGGGGGGGDDEN